MLKALLLPSGTFNRGRNAPIPVLGGFTRVQETPMHAHSRKPSRSTRAGRGTRSRTFHFISALVDDMSPAGESAMKTRSSESLKIRRNQVLSRSSHAFASFSSLETPLEAPHRKWSPVVLDSSEIGAFSVPLWSTRHAHISGSFGEFCSFCPAIKP